jgi:hypothetical protein
MGLLSKSDHFARQMGGASDGVFSMHGYALQYFMLECHDVFILLQMNPITKFKAFWHPGMNAFGIDVFFLNGQSVRLPIESPDEFVAILAVLNSPSPAMTSQGHIVCGGQ